jgi:hypothetical protein
MIRSNYARFLMAAGLLCAPVALAGNAAEPVGEPVLEQPTLRSLGAYWIVKGDDNQDATIHLAYRKVGAPAWTQGMPLLRIQKDKQDPSKHEGKGGGPSTLLKVPSDARLFAGSALLLEPDTEYELKLSLQDADGGASEKMLKTRTAAEPVEPKGQNVLYVIPGDGGGSGTKADPFKGLTAAIKAAKAGDTVLIGAGEYPGGIDLHKSGEPGKPLIFRGETGAVIDGNSGGGDGTHNAIDGSELHDVWFENLEIRHAKSAIVVRDSTRLVIRRCHFHAVDFGLIATKDSKNESTGFFITDNVMEGPSSWPRAKGIEDARGVQIVGAGHVVAYNRIRAFGDAIDTFQGNRVEAIDFHNNDVSELTDDGFELDYAQRNVRCFENRLTNVYQGISVQPVFGGPAYIFRNTMYNVGVEAFKLHNSPSGVLLMHNTVVRAGEAWTVQTPKAPMSNIITRNNLFIGTTASTAIEFDVPAENCDFDYDGIGGASFKNFLRWNKKKYATIDEAKKDAPIYKHAVWIDPAKAFASGTKAPEDVKTAAAVGVDLTLAPESPAVDAGTPIPGLNDGFAGKAPDLGALEQGQPAPHYGPRDEKK